MIVIVENVCFQRMVKYAVPEYKLPSPRILTRMIDNKYEYFKNIFKEKIKSAPDLVFH